MNKIAKKITRRDIVSHSSCIVLLFLSMIP